MQKIICIHVSEISVFTYIFPFLLAWCWDGFDFIKDETWLNISINIGPAVQALGFNLIRPKSLLKIELGNGCSWAQTRNFTVTKADRPHIKLLDPLKLNCRYSHHKWLSQSELNELVYELCRTQDTTPKSTINESPLTS